MSKASNLEHLNDFCQSVYINKDIIRKADDCLMVTIDSSTKKTGISFFLNGVLWKIALIDLDKEKDIEIRFKYMSYLLLQVLIKFKPYILYIEETVVNRNVSTQRFLSRLQGVVYAWCVLNDCEYNTIRPTEWREELHFLQGKNHKREELKQQAVSYIEEKLGILVNDDAAESACIGFAVLKNWEKISQNVIE